MAWNDPGTKDPGGRTKNNSNLDGVFKEFKKTIDDLLGSNNTVPPSPKKSAGFLSAIILAIYFLSGIYIVNDGERGVVLQFGSFNEHHARTSLDSEVCSIRRDCRCKQSRSVQQSCNAN